MTDPIINSLELAAEKVGDITELIYDRYFSDCPGSKALMIHVDEGVRGKMIQELMRLIMVEDYKDEEGYLNFEVNFHKTSFSVQGHMYKSLLNAVHSVMRSSLETEWSDEFEQAWSHRIEQLVQELEQRHNNHP